MKKLILLILVNSMFLSCVTYQSFISVDDRTDIQDGSKEIILKTDYETVKNAFINRGILIRSLEGGGETEEIFIDEGTRAMYKINEFDDVVRVTCYWGITQKVKSRVTTIAGADAANAYNTEGFERVFYQKDSIRPKRVFDYAVQILETEDLNYQIR